MKTKIKQFYREKIQPKLEALKARARQLKQRVGDWLTRHQRSLGLTVGGAAALVVIAVIVAYLWQRSPAFRATVKSLTATVTGLWALHRGRRPTDIPVPVVVTEPPRSFVAKAAFPVESSRDEGRL